MNDFYITYMRMKVTPKGRLSKCVRYMMTFGEHVLVHYCNKYLRLDVYKEQKCIS